MNRRSSAVRVMVRLMTKGPSTAPDLAEQLGLKYEAVKNALKTLRGLGFIKLRGVGQRRAIAQRGSLPYVWEASVDEANRAA